MKKLFTLTAAVLLLFFCGCEQKQENTNLLTLATSASFPPYEFISGQQIVGIDVVSAFTEAVT